MDLILAQIFLNNILKRKTMLTNNISQWIINTMKLYPLGGLLNVKLPDDFYSLLLNNLKESNYKKIIIITDLESLWKPLVKNINTIKIYTYIKISSVWTKFPKYDFIWIDNLDNNVKLSPYFLRKIKDKKHLNCTLWVNVPYVDLDSTMVFNITKVILNNDIFYSPCITLVEHTKSVIEYDFTPFEQFLYIVGFLFSNITRFDYLNPMYNYIRFRIETDSNYSNEKIQILHRCLMLILSAISMNDIIHELSNYLCVRALNFVKQNLQYGFSYNEEFEKIPSLFSKILEICKDFDVKDYMIVTKTEWSKTLFEEKIPGVNVVVRDTLYDDHYSDKLFPKYIFATTGEYIINSQIQSNISKYIDYIPNIVIFRLRKYRLFELAVNGMYLYKAKKLHAWCKMMNRLNLNITQF